MPTTEQLLSALNSIGLLILLLRILLLGLLSSLRYLSVYLTILAFESALPFVMRTDTNAYGYSYFALQSLNLLVAAGVTAEIYGLALASHPALASFGRSVLKWAVAAAIVIAGFSAEIDRSVLPGQFNLLHRYLTVERTGDLIMLLLLLMISLYLTWFPVILPRNTLIYAAGFAVLFFARAFGMLAINLLSQRYLIQISNLALLLELGCVVFWIWGFRRGSEDKPTLTGHRWNPKEIDRLTKQLDSINAALEQFGRK